MLAAGLLKHSSWSELAYVLALSACRSSLSDAENAKPESSVFQLTLRLHTPNACLRLGIHQFPETGCFSITAYDFREYRLRQNAVELLEWHALMLIQLEGVNPAPVLNIS